MANEETREDAALAVDECRPRGSLEWLVGVMRRLLAPEGCPWDREQTLESLRPFLVEETYEVLDAIAEEDPAHHAEELGDLLFQIVFQAEVAKLPMQQLITSIGDKLIRRHPHVFGQVTVADAEEVKVNWEQIKREERGRPRGTLEGVPRSMPALERAYRLTQKAARVGFDWPDVPSVRAKVAEELGELDDAAGAAPDQPAAASAPPSAEVTHEVGDLLFAVVNWARKLGVEPEAALRGANARFEARFGHVEKELAARGSSPSESTLEEMDRLWDEAKARERG